METVWRNALSGREWRSFNSDFDTTEYRTKFAGLVSDFDPHRLMPVKEWHVSAILLYCMV